MKTTILSILLFLLSPVAVFSQTTLQSTLNLPRVGDEIIKQQVNYKDPGRSGENVIWDFGQLESVNDSYSLVYREPFLFNDSIYVMGKTLIPVANLSENDYLFTGTEHRTMYYYLYSDSALWTLGHENATTRLQYTTPLLSGIFPAKYGDSRSKNYTAKGIYSMTVPFETTGHASVEADAYGMMVLPSGDTLKHVLRTKAIQSIIEVLPTPEGDTVTLNTRMESYKWYSQGYRYPIFETLHTLVYRDSTETDRFETAFFYPPQDHYYLDDDEENLALLEDSAETGVSDPWAGLSYNIFPNPVKTFLEVELYLPREADIRIQLRNTMGLIVLNENKGHYPQGICSFRLDAYSLSVGNYILDIWLNDRLISEIIMKR